MVVTVQYRLGVLGSLAHPALRQEYLDRIIEAQDRMRAARPQLRPLIHAALGAHAAALWPDFHAFVLLDEPAPTAPDPTA